MSYYGIGGLVRAAVEKLKNINNDVGNKTNKYRYKYCFNKTN
jgi:hypothetical protein